MCATRLGVAGGRWPVTDSPNVPLAPSHRPPTPCRSLRIPAGRSLVSLSLWLLVVLGTGCRVLKTTAELPGQTVQAVTRGKPDQNPVDSVELQENLCRFAHEFSARLATDLEQLCRGTNALAPAAALQWKIALGTETTAIASGPNALANLLDMTVFVSLNRMALQEYWLPNVFGTSAQPLLESCRNGETQIWRIAGTVLKTAQQAELRQAIQAWRPQNPHPEISFTAHACDLASLGTKSSENRPLLPTSVFNLLNLDPLAGLDPATRELAQTRLFAERALFVTREMPQLLRWQTELLSANTVALPPVIQLVSNSTQITASVERFASAAEKLPGQLHTERVETLKDLESQAQNLTPLVSEVRQTLAAGSQMSTSLNITLTTFTALMERFGVGETNRAGPPGTNSEPFRIRDYGQTAAQLEATARQLTELLVTFDRTLGSTNLGQLSAHISPVVQQAQTGGKEIVDYACWKGVQLLVAVLAAGLLYRWLAARPMFRRQNE